jgi:hypothetical protein
MKNHRIKKFNEMFSNYNYDYIIHVLIKDYHWGNVIVNEIKEFENSDISMPADDDEYIAKFNKWLFFKFKSPERTERDDLVVKPPISWYAKST